MSNSCLLCPQINGKDSILFREIEDYIGKKGNRAKIKALYALSFSPKAFELALNLGIDIKYHSNGEMTLKSLLDISGIDRDDAKLINKLNNEINAGNHSDIQSALKSIYSFNLDSEWNSNYMATVTANNDGTFKTEVVPNTITNKLKLLEVIRKQSLLDRLLSYLALNGVDTSFILGADSRYSTENADRLANGLYGLVQVGTDSENVEDSLAEEAGHFTVAAFKDMAITQRLIDLLKDGDMKDYAEAIVGKDWKDRVLSKNPYRELAGLLVGKALKRELDTSVYHPVAVLANRIANYAKRVLAFITRNKVLGNVAKAEMLASQIASGAVNYDDSIDLNNALNTKETLYDKSTKRDTYQTSYLLSLESMTNMYLELKAINSNLADLIGSAINIIDSDNEHDTNRAFKTLVDIDVDKKYLLIAMEGAVLCLDYVNSLICNDIKEKFKKIDLNNTDNVFANLDIYGNLLREIRIILSNSAKIVEAVHTLINEKNPYLNDFSINGKKVPVAELKNKVTKELENYMANHTGYLLIKEKELFTKYLEYANCGNSIHFDLELTYSGVKEARDVDISELVEVLRSDDSLLYNITPLANSKDPVNCLLAKITDAAKDTANKSTLETYYRIQLLIKEFLAAGLKESDMPKFFERDDEGYTTGNYINSKNWGKWSKDLELFKKDLLEEFNLKYPKEFVDLLNQFLKGLLYEQFYRPKIHEWHVGNEKKGLSPHSEYNDENGRYEPIEKNPLYTKLMNEIGPKGLKFYLDFMALKRELDSVYTDMPDYRAPLMVGNNRMLWREAKGLGKIKALAQIAIDSCILNENDVEYLLELESIKYKDLVNFSDSVLTLPMRYTRKLKDPKRLKVDLFGGLLAYAEVSNEYSTLNKIKDAAVIGVNVLKRRDDGEFLHLDSDYEKLNWKLKNIIYLALSHPNPFRKDESNCYKHYCDYVKHLIFLNSSIAVLPFFKKRISISKCLNSILSLGTYLMLRNNWAGGLVNTTTGVINILEESGVGLFLDKKSFLQANAIYFKNLAWSGPLKKLKGGNIKNVFKQFKDDKLSLFVYEFNTRGDFSRSMRTKHYENTLNGIASFVWHDLEMLPYSSGDHYMLTIPYLLMACHLKVYDSNGNETSIYDSYKYLTMEDGSTQLQMMSDKDSNNKTIDIEELSLRRSISDKFARAINESQLANVSKKIFSQKELDYISKILADLGYNNLYDTLENIFLETRTQSMFFKSKEDALLYPKIIKTILFLDRMKDSSIDFDSLDSDILDVLKKYSKFDNMEDINKNWEFIKSDIYHELKLQEDRMPWNEIDRSEFILKCRALCIRMHGAYNDSDKTKFLNHWFTKLFMSMKGYVIGRVLTYLAGSRYDARLKLTTEGIISTDLKLACNIIKGHGGLNLKYQVARLLFATFASKKYKDKWNADLKKHGLSEFLIGNITRTGNSIMMSLFLRVLSAFLFSLGDDDDEMYKLNYSKENIKKVLLENYGISELELDTPEADSYIEKLRFELYIANKPLDIIGMFYYIFSRCLKEHDAYTLITESSSNEMHNIISLPPALTILLLAAETLNYGINDILKEYKNPKISKEMKKLLISELGKELYDEVKKQYIDSINEYNKGVFYSETILGNHYKGLSIFEKRMERFGFDASHGVFSPYMLNPFARSSAFFFNPRGLYESWEYGLKVKN